MDRDMHFCGQPNVRYCDVTLCAHQLLMLFQNIMKQAVNWIGTKSDRQSQKWGSSPQKRPTMTKYGSTPPPS